MDDPSRDPTAIANHGEKEPTMTDPGDEKPTSNEDSLHPEPESPAPAEAPENGDLYAVVEPAPDSCDLGTGVTAPGWYMATAEHQKEGPLSLTEMKLRVASGRLGAETLVWRSGMPGWVPARTVAELFETAAMPGSPPPPPLPEKSSAGTMDNAVAMVAGFLRQIDSAFSSAWVYRITGHVCAGLGALALLVAFILLALRLPMSVTWFMVFVLFGMIFLVCQAAATMLQGLERIETQVAKRPDPAQDLDDDQKG